MIEVLGFELYFSQILFVNTSILFPLILNVIFSLCQIHIFLSVPPSPHFPSLLISGYSRVLGDQGLGQATCVFVLHCSFNWIEFLLLFILLPIPYFFDDGFMVIFNMYLDKCPRLVQSFINLMGFSSRWIFHQGLNISSLNFNWWKEAITYIW